MTTLSPVDSDTADQHRDDLSFQVDGETVRAWHYPGRGERFAGPDGRPVVVMAHGLGATKDSALPGFAERLSAAGLDVVLFDYRNFGDSDGAVRQVISIRGQLADYRGAIQAARALPGVDPAKVIVWGVSFSGGHVFNVAADDPRVAGVIAMTPAPDGMAAAVQLLRNQGPLHLARSMAVGLRDVARAARRRPPVLAPIVGEPGSIAALTAPGALDKHLQMVGPTWRNELAARIFLQVGNYRPIRRAKQVRVPMLMQVADYDRSAPPAAAMNAGVRARAEIRHYPCDHFDVYPGEAWFESVVTHQIEFLTRHFGNPDAEDA
ncbi:alpha/beta hydrolase [[Mycobacterium] wendilense]|uniref:Alpha/beta fold hydrolase n=1 Tax=[Mycobacterium] wendilense TaxID=3064284 RepID=A0ABN9NXD1_9MYCO|nr:alpha/beta fold hydrolase [Mycolicibacterium sp. MU0050]CAJ1581922.1 alpha/beta fold hydrolase [Mycolicibacterium sp. MU0050]